jgi:acylphosphatase
MRRVLVRYYGHVQGVGFRATVRAIAADFKVTGWVKNMPDGSVEMVASAEESELEAFLGSIRKSPLRGYFNKEVEETAPSGGLAPAFEIRYS